VLRFAADENVKRQIVTGLRRRSSALSILTVREATLEGMSDPEILTWAAAEDRILLTHDIRTMATHAYARAAAREPMPGLVEIPDRMPIGQAIDEVLLIAELASAEEMRDRVLRLPL
jgi:hypothetical protein